MNPDYKELDSIQKEFFYLLDEIFKKSTGKSYSKLCAIEDFDDTVRTGLPSKIRKVGTGIQWGYKKLESFYRKYKNTAFTLPRKLGSLKLLLGSERFTENHFDSIRKMILYADTILIPDPVLPWVETERAEERFRDVNFLKAIFILLQLKPLVDAGLEYPTIIVFPSWEKTLEQQDKCTKDAIFTFAHNFFSFYLETKFGSLAEVTQYIMNDEKEFLKEVEEGNLFIAPGRKETGDIKKTVIDYKEFMKTWRSPEYLRSFENLSDGLLVFNGIMERLTPQYHLFENSEEFQSQPLLCLDVHWHYYSLCAKIHEKKLLKEQFLKRETVAIIQSLNDKRFQWLGNVEMKDLVTLRQDNCNEQFRKRLSQYVNELHESTISDVDRVANEISRGIAGLLMEHQGEIKKIEDSYSKKHLKTLTAAILTAAAVFLPTLAPLTGIVPPLALATKYFWDKMDEIEKRNAVSKSLMGVLAKTSKQG